jgi:hypothetical protein
VNWTKVFKVKISKADQKPGPKIPIQIFFTIIELSIHGAARIYALEEKPALAFG